MKCLVANPFKSEVVLIVDVHNLAWKSYYAPVKDEMIDKDGYPAYHYNVALGKIQEVVTYLFKYYEKVCVALSSDEYPIKKKTLFPEYKAQRKNILKEYNVKTLDGVVETKPITPIDDIKRVLKLIPHCSLRIPSKDEESDDIIATASCMFKKKHIQSYILSTDGDMWYLKSKFVHIIYKEYPNLCFVNRKLLEKRFYVNDFRLVPLVKTLIGDSSDNLKGVYRFPRKVLSKLTYDMYKGKIKKALPKVSAMLSGKVKSTMDNDISRLIKLHSIVKLNKHCDIEIKKSNGDFRKLFRFVKAKKLTCKTLLDYMLKD